VATKTIHSIALVLIAISQRTYAENGLSLANTSHSLGNGKSQWTAFVNGPSDIVGRIVCVEYNLDPTFPDPSRLVCEKGSDAEAFALTDTAWGEFNLTATVIFGDRTVKKLALSVKLQGTKPTSRSGTILQMKVVNRSGIPVPDAPVLVVTPDGRYVSGLSKQDGSVSLEFFDTARPMVLCAHTGFSGSFRAEVDPSKPAVLELTASAGGSIIIENGTGYIQGLDGRLNPILDAQHRSYIYADNIAIEGDSIQPFHFTLGRPFRVVDVKGRAFSLTVIAMRGRSFLINYIPTR